MSEKETSLPRWNLETIFPGPCSPEFEAALETGLQLVKNLSELFDQYGVHARPTSEVNAADVHTFQLTVEYYNATFEQLRTLSGYLHCLLSVNAQDEAAQARGSVLQKAIAQFNTLTTRWSAWVGSLDVDALLLASETAKGYAFVLRNAQTRSRHLMSEGEEELASELTLSGSKAWAKLYHALTSQITLELDGKKVPLSLARARACDPNRHVRRETFTAELAAWEQWSLPLAAALNSLKGETLTLAKRRRWPSVLDAALFECHMDRTSFEMMMDAAVESFSHFRRYLRTKAKLLGLERLAWYDLNAPVSGRTKLWTFLEAKKFLLDRFAAFSPRLANLARHAFEEQWIDAEPRHGKQNGAFTVGIRGGETRILINYKSSFADVVALAHELGHAYHTAALASRPALQRAYPKTLAETASLLCETLVRQALYKEATPSERLAILEASLQGTCQTVVDVACRYFFEQKLFEKRAQRELSVGELNALALEAQRDTYGDGLDPLTLHPFMWAMKPHSYGYTFYNFPYLFGQLFALGLYTWYRAHPRVFRRRYEDFLAATGVENCRDIARRFGIDLHAPGFWKSSLNIVREEIDEFEALVAKETTSLMENLSDERKPLETSSCGG